jgi:ABC-type multidrug transport system ATPase subunit
VDAALISYKTQPSVQSAELLRLGGVADVHLSTTVKSFATLQFRSNLGGSFAGLFFGVAFVFAFLSSVVLILKSLVLEKELRIREAMLISGLRPAVYWLSWFITHYASLALVCVGMALIGTRAFEYSSPGVLLLFYLVWTFTLVMFCYAISAFFTTSKMASIVGSLLYILTWVPAVGSTSGDGALGNAGWTATCFLPASSLYMWGLAVALLENAERGVTMETLFLNLLSTADGAGGGAATFSAGAVLLITAGSGVAYALIAVYLDLVMPRGDGAAARPWYFPATALRAAAARAACRAAAAVAPAGASSTATTALVTTSFEDHSWPTDGEVAADALLQGGVEASAHCGAPAVALCRLSKTFPLPAAQGGCVAAVDALTLNVHGGEVTALLGHNGAGKTTTIGMLCGLLPPSGGSATVSGVPLAQMDAIRRSVGWCPQHDVLWPSLTCEEHVRLYLAFRGSARAHAAAAASAALAAVGLSAKAEAAACTLSGGQRRRLSLAIAFAGNPSLVLLDEPTTGMDAFSRRRAWVFIRGQKAAGRAIVLSTHFMEEADLLCDRIAIMSAGKLAAVGSPVFLKARLGLGYHLSMHCTRCDGAGAGDGADDGALPSVVHALSALVEQHFPNAVLESAVGSELSFLLPPDGDDAEGGTPLMLPALLRHLEERGPALGCAAFGLTASTMEEVFLSIAENCGGARMSAGQLRATAVAAKRAAAALRCAPQPPLTPPSARRALLEAAAAEMEGEECEPAAWPVAKGGVSASAEGVRLVGGRLVVAQLAALLRKRLLHARRDRLSWVTQYAVPVAFFALALGLAHLGSLHAGLPATAMGPSFLANRPIRCAAAAAGLAPAEAAAFQAGLPGSDWLAVHTQWSCSPLNGSAAAAGASAAAAIAIAGPFSGLLASLVGSGAASSCMPAVQSCADLGCTPGGPPAAATLDAAVLATTRPHENCRQAAGGACGALFLTRASRAQRHFAFTLSTSPSSFHALPAMQAAADGAALSALLGRPAAITAVNHPLPRASGGGDANQALMLHMLIGMCAVLGLGCLSAATSVFLVAERRAGAKHLQLVSGVSRAAFWASTAMWDVANFCVPLALIVAAFAASALPAYTGGGALGVVAAALALFGASAIPLAYVLHFAFNDEMNSMAGQLAVYYFFGIAQTRE